MEDNVFRHHASCQHHRPPYTLVPGFMVNKPAPERIFSRVALDYIERRPPTKAGNQFALVMIDQTSRYVIAAPTPTQRADDTIRLVEEYLLAEWGTPSEFVCDNGTHFRNKKFHKFCHDLGIKVIHTAAHHPQSNGMVENANNTIKT